MGLSSYPDPLPDYWDLGEVAPYVDTLNSHKEYNGIEVTHRSQRSRRMKLLQDFLRQFRPHVMVPSFEQPRGSIRLKPPRHLALRGCVWTERILKDTWIYDVAPKKPFGIGEHYRRRIYYFAGGSWQKPPSLSHWRFVAKIARRLLNTTVSVISQPLAPRSPAHESMPHLARLYTELMEQSQRDYERVIWAGDDSGANVALCQVLWSLAREGPIKPAAVMAICPVTDLRHTDEKIFETVDKDPLLTLPFIYSAARHWAWGTQKRFEKAESPPSSHSLAFDMEDPRLLFNVEDPRVSRAFNVEDPRVSRTFDMEDPRISWEFDMEDPRVSPIRARLDLFSVSSVKVHGVTAGYDILSSEALAFRNQLHEQGVAGEWLHWDKQMHGFPLAHKFGLRESSEALDWIVQVLGNA